MAHKFVIEKNKAGEFVAKFKYNSETIFWASKAGAKNAIESVLKNGPGAAVEEAE
ncbi:YegP family protein [Sphingobium limneticum]|jgi:uncharacterized protein YegP (UPF0339 family)|uniref:DUF1508 domain-containing protein n=1 Tax=Sphingobium limneticum TaxID=1007511 RepID=A0A5J5I9U0_9SPHN|nr:DUF1508 domain-containing protein [Sphingobium limneticum]KAA9020856.1 DUF1508 domain-containing protein [Sphingobium limneticum]KAA9033183.1 DUF1508 domain-containing protein [Sphingobium limneticum]